MIAQGVATTVNFIVQQRYSGAEPLRRPADTGLSESTGRRYASAGESALVPFTVGMIGGGQLARMMDEAVDRARAAAAAAGRGPDVSAATVVHDVTVGDYTDPTTVRPSPPAAT